MQPFSSSLVHVCQIKVVILLYSLKICPLQVGVKAILYRDGHAWEGEGEGEKVKR